MEDCRKNLPAIGADKRVRCISLSLSLACLRASMALGLGYTQATDDAPRRCFATHPLRRPSKAASPTATPTHPCEHQNRSMDIGFSSRRGHGFWSFASALPSSVVADRAAEDCGFWSRDHSRPSRHVNSQCLLREVGTQLNISSSNKKGHHLGGGDLFLPPRRW